MNHLLTTLILLLISILLGLKGFFKDKTKQKYLLWFFLIFTVDQLLARLPKMLPAIDFIGGQYNWTGKILALVLSVIIVLELKKHFQLDFAFTLKQAPGSFKSVVWILSGLLIIQFIYFYYTTPARIITGEDFAFQLTLPGLTEEIMFRGILLGLLDGVFVNKRKVFGAYLGWGTIFTAILFALWHGIRFDKELHFQINYLPMLLPLFAGFILAWTREKTKSIAIPVIYHSLIDGLITVVPLLK